MIGVEVGDDDVVGGAPGELATRQALKGARPAIDDDAGVAVFDPMASRRAAGVGHHGARSNRHQAHGEVRPRPRGRSR